MYGKSKDNGKSARQLPNSIKRMLGANSITANYWFLLSSNNAVNIK